MADFPGTAGDDSINGTTGDDTISDGGAGNDSLNGGDGNDVITSTGGTDTVDGGTGTDRLIMDFRGLLGGLTSTVNATGGTFNRSGVVVSYTGIENITFFGSGSLTGVTLNAGNHIVVGGGSQDSFSAIAGASSWDGAGSTSDSINYGRATAAIFVNAHTGNVLGATINDTIANIEAIFATNFDDVLFGGTETRTLGGGSGNDVMDTGTSTQNMILQGQLGNDTYVIRSAAGTVTISETAGTDRVETDLATYELPTDVENLEYFGSAAFNGTGNASANIIRGGAMGDTLSGLAGNDTLGGEAGDDSLSGGNGNDRLTGGTGADMMDGGDGNDILIVDNAGDVAIGGIGTDTVQIIAAGTYTIGADIEVVQNHSSDIGQVEVTLNALANTYGGGGANDRVSAGDGDDIVYGRTGHDLLRGEVGNDRLFGDAGHDSLYGGDGADLLYGGAGNDIFEGDGGNDTLYGEAGADFLYGGTGQDLMLGGGDADTFVFRFGDTGSTIATADRIRDFSSAQGDKLDVSNYSAASFIGSAAFSNSAGEVRAQLIGGNTYVMGDQNGDGVADFVIRLDGNVALSIGDFIIAS